MELYEYCAENYPNATLSYILYELPRPQEPVMATEQGYNVAVLVRAKYLKRGKADPGSH